MTAKPIPKGLLSLLAEPWRTPPNGGAGVFEAVFTDQDRRRDPSFYFAYEGSRSPNVDMLRFAEVAALKRDGVLNPGLAAIVNPVSGPRQTVTNEHAQHAVIDFCEACYAAWDTLQLDQIAQACPPARTPPAQTRPQASEGPPTATLKASPKQVLH